MELEKKIQLWIKQHNTLLTVLLTLFLLGSLIISVVVIKNHPVHQTNKADHVIILGHP